MRVLAVVSGVGRGHAARSRPILDALRDRGHHCVAAALGRRAGALLAPSCPVLLPPPGFHQRVAPRPTDLAYVCVYDFEMSFSFYQRDVLDSTRAVVEFVAGAVERVRPDVVLVDQVPPATAVARARGLRVVQLTHGPLFARLGPWAYWLRQRPAGVRYPPPLSAVNDALAEARVPPIAHVDELLEGDLTVVPTPPELGSAAGALHVDVPAVLDERSPAVVRRPGRQLVAVLLGNTPALLEPVVRAVLAARADLVAVEADRARLPDDPAVQAVGAVDATSLLRQVDAAVHHGGSGSIVTCLQAGIPSVAVPTQGEQDFNAHRLEEAGFGLRVAVSEESLEEVAIRDGYSTLAHREPHALEQRLAAALERLQPLVAAPAPLPGPGPAADAIASLG